MDASVGGGCRRVYKNTAGKFLLEWKLIRMIFQGLDLKKELPIVTCPFVHNLCAAVGGQNWEDFKMTPTDWPEFWVYQRAIKSEQNYRYASAARPFTGSHFAQLRIFQTLRVISKNAEIRRWKQLRMIFWSSGIGLVDVLEDRQTSRRECCVDQGYNGTAWWFAGKCSVCSCRLCFDSCSRSDCAAWLRFWPSWHLLWGCTRSANKSRFNQVLPSSFNIHWILRVGSRQRAPGGRARRECHSGGLFVCHHHPLRSRGGGLFSLGEPENCIFCFHCGTRWNSGTKTVWEPRWAPIHQNHIFDSRCDLVNQRLESSMLSCIESNTSWR